MSKFFSRKKAKEPETTEYTGIDIDETKKNHRYVCVRCGKQYGLWGKDEIALYRIVKPDYEVPPPKESVCPLCLKVGQITTEIDRIGEELDTSTYMGSIKGMSPALVKQNEELKARNRGLKEELVRLKQFLPGK